jgi:hypothetical protein
MTTNLSFGSAAFLKRVPGEANLIQRRLGCRIFSSSILPLLILTLPAMAQAQFDFTTNDGTITITGYTGTGGSVTVPGMTNGLPVTSIGSWAFFNCASITDINIPESLTDIGEAAFAGCANLSSLEIPNCVRSIGNSAFSPCQRLAIVTIGKSVTSIGNGAFATCPLSSVVIPDSVTHIGDSAFYECLSLGIVTIGNGVTSIGSEAFADCMGLTNIDFYGNAPEIGASVFDGHNFATVYYLPGTTGWGPTFGGLPTALWFLPNPLILNNGTSFGVGGNGFGFMISWATNIPVVVEATTTLTTPAWFPVSTNTLGNGSSYFSDPHWTNYSSRFYRLHAP